MAISDVEGVCNLAMAMLGANRVTDVTGSPSEDEELVCSDVYEQARDELYQLENYNWNFAKRHLMLNYADGYEESYYDEVTITNITQADPAVVTAASHGFSDGWLVKISDVAGMTEINDRVVRVANKEDDTFECYGLNSTKFTAYSSGGEAIRYEIEDLYQNGYVYDVPADFMKAVTVLPDGSDWELVGSGNSQRILCSSDEAYLVYVAQVTTLSEMPKYFYRLWAASIALNAFPSLLKKSASRKELLELYEYYLQKAMLADSRNANPNTQVRETERINEAGGWN